MKKIIDDSGNTLSGMFRDKNGCIVIKDNNTFNKYKQEQEIIDLKERLIKMETLLNKLLEKTNG